MLELVHILEVDVGVCGGMHVREGMRLGIVVVFLHVKPQSVGELPEEVGVFIRIDTLLVLKNQLNILEDIRLLDVGLGDVVEGF